MSHAEAALLADWSKGRLGSAGGIHCALSRRPPRLRMTAFSVHATHLTDDRLLIGFLHSGGEIAK